MSTEPLTEAGKALLERLGWFASEKGDALREGVLAIEAESARAAQDVGRFPSSNLQDDDYLDAIKDARAAQDVAGRPGITTLGEQKAYQAGWDAGRADALGPSMELQPVTPPPDALREALLTHKSGNIMRCINPLCDAVFSEPHKPDCGVGRFLAALRAQGVVQSPEHRLPDDPAIGSEGPVDESRDPA